MKAPQVSVVLPAFNAAQTIRCALESLRRQTLTAWELILVNDASTDDTAGIAQDWGRDEPRLRLIEQPKQGIVTALNRGLEEARSGLIARMDADDIAHPERLAVQAEFLKRQPELGVAGCLVRFGGNPLAAGGYALHVAWVNSVVDEESIRLNRFVESPFAHPSVMFRREMVERFGGYRDGCFPEDYELWLRWLDAGVKMAKVPRELLTWNDWPGRLSRTDARYDSEAFYRCKAEYLARWLKREVDDQRSLLVWGAGRPTRRRAGYLEAQGVRIGAYIDIDPRKIGQLLDGRRVISPEQLPVPENCFVLGYVGKRGARDLARSYLGERGFVEGRDYLMAA